MKEMILPLLGILLLAGCEKEAATPIIEGTDSTLDFRSVKRTVCHYTGSETNPYEIIEVADKSWINAHREHGDAVDMDGDGYFDRKNGCSQIIDCDDSDPNVYETCVPTITSATGQIWMDRNLGATQVATSSTDVNSYGYLYQWGRGTDGHQVRTSSTTADLSSMDQPGHGDFILSESSPFDWRTSKNDNLWQGVDGENNPCPTGFRVPTQNEWLAEDIQNAADAFNKLKLPLAGGRGPRVSSVSEDGVYGFYWSATTSGTRSSDLVFKSSDAYWGAYARAGGLSVRCIKD